MANPWDRVSEQINDMMSAQAERDASLRERMAVNETKIENQVEEIELLHKLREKDIIKLDSRFQELEVHIDRKIDEAETRISTTVVTGRIERKEKRFSDWLRFWSPVIVAILGFFGVALSVWSAVQVSKMAPKIEIKGKE